MELSTDMEQANGRLIHADAGSTHRANPDKLNNTQGADAGEQQPLQDLAIYYSLEQFVICQLISIWIGDAKSALLIQK